MNEQVPEHCPGTDSEEAGKASACDGCPNQKICASAQPQAPDPAIEEIRIKLSKTKHKILILSGKGGVGKSTVSCNLARGFALNEDLNISLLDIDICGPSVPTIMGVEGEQVHHSASGWSPVYVQDNLAVMSVGFLLPSADEAIIWRGPKKNGLIKQFLRDVDWEEQDFLLVDTPPGTSDEHLSIIQYLAQCDIDGAIIVTTPPEVALSDVRKEINFCKKVSLPVIGVIENMSSFVCPNCTHVSQIFPPSGGGVREMTENMGVPYLGSLPLDPRLAWCCDKGLSLFDEHADSPVTLAYRDIIGKIKLTVEKNGDEVPMVE